MYRYYKQKRKHLPSSSMEEFQTLELHQDDSSSCSTEYSVPMKRARCNSASDVSEASSYGSPALEQTNALKSVPLTSLKRSATINRAAYVSEEEQSIQRSNSIDDQSQNDTETEGPTRNKAASRRPSFIQTKKSVRMTFDDYFEEMKTFKRVHGHVRVTPKYDKKLANWVADMRNIRRQKNKWYGRKVTEGQLKALDDLGFIWNPTKEEGGEKTFEYRIEQLKKFKAKNGHLRVTVKHDKNLSYFCSNIRAARRHAGRKRILKVTKERIKALDDLGFAWEPKPTQGDLAFWNHVKEMKTFKEKYGHVHITAKLDKKLAIFCTNMRNARRKTHTTRRLTQERIDALDALGFIWDPGQDRTLTSFEERVDQLKNFKATHGHLNVLPKHNKKLAKFCAGIRKARIDPGRGRMVVTDEKIKVLDAIGFDWENAQGTYFDECFDLLTSFKSKHGHINVSKEHDESLANFCENIRNARRLLDRSGRFHLSGRIKDLDDLGFDWTVQN